MHPFDFTPAEVIAWLVVITVTILIGLRLLFNRTDT